MGVVATIAITASVLFPTSYNNFFPDSRFNSFTEGIQGMIPLAKAEPRIQSSNSFYNPHSADTFWCIKFITQNNGGFTKASSCMLPVASISEFQVVNGFELGNATIAENYSGAGKSLCLPRSSLSQVGVMSSVPGLRSLAAGDNCQFFGRNKNV